jgi:hypothetical protein
MRTCGDRISIVLRAYLDSGGDVDPKQNKIVTLACYSSTDKDWTGIEGEWTKAVLKAWDGCVVQDGMTPHLHTQALVAGTKPFTTENGWTAEKRFGFLQDCSRIIAEHCSDGKLKGISASVILADFKKVYREFPETPHFQDICCFFCVSRGLAWSHEIAVEFLANGGSVYFDRTDPFRGAVTNLWNNGKFVHKHRDTWGKLENVGCVIMQHTPAIQMADILAWSINAKYLGWIHGEWQTTLLDVDRPFLWLNEAILRHPDKSEIGRWPELGLPKRRVR